jgi:hypothetical protein
MASRRASVVLRDAQRAPLEAAGPALRLPARRCRTPSISAFRCTSSTPKSPPASSSKGGNVARTHNDIEVSCLPQDLPAFIEVDLKDLEHRPHRSTFPNSSSPPGHAGLHGDDQVVVSIIGQEGCEARSKAKKKKAPLAAQEGKPPRIGRSPASSQTSRRPALAAHGGLFYLRFLKSRASRVLRRCSCPPTPPDRRPRQPRRRIRRQPAQCRLLVHRPAGRSPAVPLTPQGKFFGRVARRTNCGCCSR